MSGRGSEASGQQPGLKETRGKPIERIGVVLNILAPYKAYCLGSGWTVGDTIFADLRHKKQYLITTEEEVQQGWDGPVTVLTETGDEIKRVTKIRRDSNGNIAGILQTFAGPGETGKFTAVTRVGTYAQEMANEGEKDRGTGRTSPPCFWQRLICEVSVAADTLFNSRPLPWQRDVLKEGIGMGRRVFAERAVASDRSWANEACGLMPAIKK